MTFADTRLVAESLGCRRGLAAIFEGISFTLESGAMFAVRGPNGSGKSTLLRVLSGLMKPSAGKVSLIQATARRDDITIHTHYVGHQSAITAALSVSANLAYQAALLGNPATPIPAVLERVGLAALARAPARHLSSGQRRRLALARLIAVPRPLWLLDEPGESLDMEGEKLLAEISAAHRTAGGIIVLATHEHAMPGAASELVLRPAAA